MFHFGLLLFLFIFTAGAAFPQEEDFRVYTDHPRLFLTRQRLRLLRRERDRRSPRWQQFDSLVSGNTRFPEPGFAAALYSQVSGQSAACRQAIAWSLSPAADLRQRALVFDWCQTQLTPAESRALAAHLENGIRQSHTARDVPTVRSRVLAAIALAEISPDLAARELKTALVSWWRAGLPPAIHQHGDALFEILHAVRDNFNLDLRESYPAYFKGLPTCHVLSRDPASPNECGFRSAGLAMVAYDTNAVTSQFLQGWLMQDRYLMRDPLGAPYEFLWANPYQPGLSYYHLPLLFHDPVLGRLFVRSSWEDDASWFGFSDGRSVAGFTSPLRLGPVLILAASPSRRFSLRGQEVARAFVLGLPPRTPYTVEIDRRPPLALSTDPAGILAISIPPHSAILHLK